MEGAGGGYGQFEQCEQLSPEPGVLSTRVPFVRRLSGNLPQAAYEANGMT